jgi:hypothetical protein
VLALVVDLHLEWHMPDATGRSCECRQPTPEVFSYQTLGIPDICAGTVTSMCQQEGPAGSGSKCRGKCSLCEALAACTWRAQAGGAQPAAGHNKQPEAVFGLGYSAACRAYGAASW